MLLLVNKRTYEKRATAERSNFEKMTEAFAIEEHHEDQSKPCCRWQHDRRMRERANGLAEVIIRKETFAKNRLAKYHSQSTIRKVPFSKVPFRNVPFRKVLFRKVPLANMANMAKITLSKEWHTLFSLRGQLQMK